MTQAASPAVGSTADDSRAQPDFAFVAPPAPRERAPAVESAAATAQGPAGLHIPAPALRFAAVALALLALLGAWHFWRQAQQHDAPPSPAPLPQSADLDMKPPVPVPAAAASALPSPSAQQIEATFAAVNDNRHALQSLNDGQKRQEEALNRMAHDVAELIDGFKQMQARQAAAA
ncbi:MAG TPA: hypothetical protein VFP68_20260, partial [Burkholderiaceae bacterium]|nr:hypothetical protein [Burkholderiaceae bacterium]